MRIVFMGTPTFAVPTLRSLANADNMDVVAVYTQPDSARKRGKRLVPSPVKELALEKGIEVFTPKNLKDPATAEQIRQMQPDAIIVASYGNILPKEILDIPPLGCINVHASLLPRWRGAAPIERAILSGDQVTGVSIMKMGEGLDSGPYCMQESMLIDKMYARQIDDLLADLGARMILNVMPRIAAGEVEWVEQVEEESAYAKKIEKSEMHLSPQLSALQNVRRVHASTDHAPARASICGRSLAVIYSEEADLSDQLVANAAEQMAPGQVARVNKKLLLRASDGVMEVTGVKPDGKKQMDAAGFCAGVHEVLKSGKATWEAI